MIVLINLAMMESALTMAIITRATVTKDSPETTAKSTSMIVLKNPVRMVPFVLMASMTSHASVLLATQEICARLISMIVQASHATTALSVWMGLTRTPARAILGTRES